MPKYPTLFRNQTQALGWHFPILATCCDFTWAPCAAATCACFSSHAVDADSHTRLHHPICSGRDLRRDGVDYGDPVWGGLLEQEQVSKCDKSGWALLFPGRFCPFPPPDWRGTLSREGSGSARGHGSFDTGASEGALQRQRTALGGLAREMRLVRNRNACEVGLCSDTLALMCKATTGSWTEMAAPWTAANYEGKRPCQDHLSCQNSGRQQAIFFN